MSNALGLVQKYQVNRADGSPTDPQAIYFVLRLDLRCDDHSHIDACHAAAKAYAEHVKHDDNATHLKQVGIDLNALIDHISHNELPGMGVG